MTVHALKSWPEFFQPVVDGVKTFEIRYDDRKYQVGDTLILREWDDRKAEFTGRQVERRVTYVLRGVPGGIPPLAGLQRNYVALALSVL